MISRFDEAFKGVMEARDPDAEYKTYKKGGKKETSDPSEIDQVVAELKGSKSAKINRLAETLAKIAKVEAELDEIKEPARGLSEEIDKDLFDMEDFVKTRVVKTSKVVVTWAKVQPAKSADYKVAPKEEVIAAMNELDKLILEQAKDLHGQLQAIRDRILKVVETAEIRKIAKVTEILEESKEEKADGFFGMIKDYVKKATEKVKDMLKDVKGALKEWAVDYDSGLKDIERKLAAVKKMV